MSALQQKLAHRDRLLTVALVRRRLVGAELKRLSDRTRSLLSSGPGLAGAFGAGMLTGALRSHDKFPDASEIARELEKRLELPDRAESTTNHLLDLLKTIATGVITRIVTVNLIEAAEATQLHPMAAQTGDAETLASQTRTPQSAPLGTQSA